LLLDFWLAQGVRAAAIPAAVLPMLCIALRAFGRLSPFARLSRPSNAGQAKKTRNPMVESKKGHLAALPARLKPAGGDAPSRTPCHTAFLTLARRFLIFSQVLRSAIVSQAFREYSKVLPSDMLLHWRTLLDGPAMLSYRSPLGRPSSPAGKASRKSLAHPSRGCTNHAKIVMEIPGLDPSLK
jgi:hypothetical protein